MQARPSDPLTVEDVIENTLRAIADRGTDAQILRDEITRAARLAYRLGGKASIDTMLSARHVADDLGVTRGYVTRMARRNHVGSVVDGQWLFRPEDLEELRRIKAAAVPGKRKSHYRISDGPARPKSAS